MSQEPEIRRRWRREIEGLEDLTARVLHTSGHTPGSLCFVVRAYLFASDTLFRGDIGKVAEDDPARVLKARDALVRTIKQKPLVLSGTTRVCPDQGKISTVAGYAGIIEGLVGRGAQGVILGCTEIPLLIKQKDSPVPVFDTTALHAAAAVDFALS